MFFIADMAFEPAAFVIPDSALTILFCSSIFASISFWLVCTTSLQKKLKLFRNVASELTEAE